MNRPSLALLLFGLLGFLPFFGSGISGTYNHHFFAFIKESVANGAGTYTMTIQPFFAFNTEPFCACSGSDDYAVCSNYFVAIDGYFMDRPGEIDLSCNSPADFGTESFGLLLKIDHHLRPLNALGIPGIVLYIRCNGQLTSWL